MFYLLTVPPLLRMFYGKDILWEMPRTEKKIYLSFDDGPHPVVTPFVLDLLKKYNARATFFCIGKNVEAYPEVYRRILAEGHSVGNHTYHHPNGAGTGVEEYLEDVRKAAAVIDSKLFRPPYGRIKKSQHKKILQDLGMKTVMWSVLSGDFDERLSGDQCCNNVLKLVNPGSIVVFHDSEKAWQRLSFCLPRLLERYTSLGYRFDKI